MKKMGKRLWVEMVIILLVSLLLMFFYTGGNPNIFLTDDNYSEFYPVIEQNYNTLFEEGHIPVYNFYQMNGLSIADQGYYAQTNPMMLFSYIIEHLLGMRINALSIYIFMAFSIGNMLIYLLARKMNLSRTASFLAVGMLAISTSLLNYSYWYHTFGNAIAIPIILLAIQYTMKNQDNKMCYFISGLALAFSLSLGNIQFTFYHYAMYAVIMVLLAITKKDMSYIKYLISNCLIGLLLSSPILFIQLRAGVRREGAIEIDGYYRYPNVLIKQVFYSIIPVFIMLILGRNTVIADFSNTCSSLGYGYLFSGISMLLLITYIVYLLVKVIKKIKTKSKMFDTEVDVLVFAIFGTIIFLMWWALGENGKLAVLLSYIPGAKNFRYIFKITFVFTLLLPIVSAYVLDKILKVLKEDKSKLLVIAVSVWVICLGIYNARYTLNSGINWYFNGIYSGDTRTTPNI